MKLRIFERQTEPGFRLNLADILFLALAGALSYLASQSDSWSMLAPLPLHLSAVFFVFCNIVRVRTRSEIAWMLTYASSFSVSIVFNLPLWPTVLSFSTASLAAVVLHAVTTGQSRGIFSPRAGNPSDRLQ
jgi:hypothetical protein